MNNRRPHGRSNRMLSEMSEYMLGNSHLAGITGRKSFMLVSDLWRPRQYEQEAFLCFKMNPADTKVDPQSFLGAVEGGWKPTAEVCGAESKELLQLMSFTGRQTATRVTSYIAAHMDRGWLLAGCDQIGRWLPRPFLNLETHSKP